MRRYHQERTIIRRHHRDHVLGQGLPTLAVGERPAGCFRKQHAPPLHHPPLPSARDRQEWQAARALREGVQEVWITREPLRR